MKALVTRPVEDSAEIAAALAARGIEAAIEPLLTIRFATDGTRILAPLLDGSQAVLFTSANGVRAFAAASARRDLAVFAVGDTTARAAADAGFAPVASAGGNVEDLARLVATRLAPGGGALVHAAAREAAGDLAGALADAGFAVRRAILYDAVPVARLSDMAATLLRQHAIAFALFFSPRTAETFVRLVRDARLEAGCQRGTALALSPAVAAVLAGTWRSVQVAASPTLGGLLAALDGVRERPEPS